MSTHTKTPYRAEELLNEITALDNGGCRVLFARVYGTNQDQIDSNKAFIVTACNNFEAMHCRILGLMSVLANIKMGNPIDIDAEIELARAALAKAVQDIGNK